MRSQSLQLTFNQTMMLNIALIPKDLFQNRVIALLDVVDLVNYDSSLLNHRLRPYMLEQFRGALMNTDLMKIDEHSAKWFVQRNIHVSSLLLSNTVVDLTSVKQLAFSVNTLIDLGNCEVITSNTIVDLLISCAHVKSLVLNNKFNTLPVENSISAYCEDLQRIDLSGNSIFYSHQLGALLFACNVLTEINLNQCLSWLNGQYFDVITTSCPRLQSLGVNIYTCGGDRAVQVLAQHCRDLRHLRLPTWPSLTDRGVSALTACTKLCIIDISGSKRITSQGIITLAQNCTVLEEIGIPQCDEQLYLAVGALVHHCPALKVLRRCALFFTEKSFQFLQNCSLFHTLELRETHEMYFDAVLQLLDHCSTLECLELPLTSRSFARASAPVIFIAHDSTTLHSNLLHVNFTRFASQTDFAFIPLISRCPSIILLDLCACSKLTDSSIVVVASHCKMLETINISSIPALTDTAVSALARSCFFLRSLSTVCCSLLTDEAAVALGSNCPTLRCLNMSFCMQLTDDGIVNIVKNCNLLRELELSNCNITSRVLDAVVLYGARLRSLNILMCSNIKADARNSFRSSKPNCKLL